MAQAIWILPEQVRRINWPASLLQWNCSGEEFVVFQIPRFPITITRAKQPTDRRTPPGILYACSPILGLRIQSSAENESSESTHIVLRKLSLLVLLLYSPA